MADFVAYKKICEMIDSLKGADITETNKISVIRKLIKYLNGIKTDIISGAINPTEEDLIKYQAVVDGAIAGEKVRFSINFKTETDIELFQLGVSPTNVHLDIKEDSLIPPEHGILIQKLWKIGFKDNTSGYAIVSDTSDTELSTVFGAQVSTALATAPNGAVEDLQVTLTLESLQALKESHDVSSLINSLEKPGLTSRQLRDIDIDSDPELQGLTTEQKDSIKSAVAVLNSATTSEDIDTAQTLLLEAANAAGLYSIALGPTPNFEYSDLKRFKLQKDEDTIVDVVMSMPVISWGSPILGIPLRDPNGPKDRTNRKDDGTSYIVDMGGIDPVIRAGVPNPLPATRYYNNGPTLATIDEGALDRYNGGKTLGINTTDSDITIQSIHRTSDGVKDVVVPAMSGLWKLDRSTFDLGNSHAYYTVFSASRPPPAGFMGVVFAPKQGRLGRGRGETASGKTLANGISKTGKPFNIQDENGPILDNENNEVPSGLKGLTSNYDGHGMHPVDLLKFLQNNGFVKGIQYLTIPANATLETVEDVLIPEGQFVPQITQAVGTLMQFFNGTFIPDGGPARFQSGLIPFLPGTPAYTPEWHINWIMYNCGNIDCDGVNYLLETPALDSNPESWIKPEHNASFGPPGPDPNNSRESGYSPAYPDTFNPVQFRCNIQLTKCREYVDKIKGSKNGEISLSMLEQLEEENKILITDAPAGAIRGWVKYLVVNCPLPIVLNIKVVGEEIVTVPTGPVTNAANCITCSCSRAATTISVNGALNPVWLDEDSKGNDSVIGDRVLKFKVSDHVIIRSTSGTVHGVSLRLDNMTSNTAVDNNKTLEVMQNEVLIEIKEKLTINNEQDLEHNIIALTDDVIAFQGGVPITFLQKANNNPVLFQDGVPIADFTIKDTAANSTGTIVCTVHGIAMSFRFSVCP